jgi:hypothetical protein
MTDGLNHDVSNTSSSLTIVTEIKMMITHGSGNTTIINTGNITNSRNVECIKHSLKQVRLTRYFIEVTTSIIVLRVCRFILWGLFRSENNAEAIKHTSFTFQRIFNFKFYVVRTVHFGIKLYNDQLKAQVFNLFIYFFLTYSVGTVSAPRR